MKTMTFRALAFGITFLTAVSIYGQDAPQDAAITMDNAIRMAILKNLDLQIESHTISMARTDVARSRGVYNPVFSVSGTGGVLSSTGDPFFDSRYGTAVASLSQNLPTGGNIAASTQAGYTSIGTDIPGTISNDWQSTVGLTLTQPLLKNAGKDTFELNITLASNTYRENLERFRLAAADTVLAAYSSYNHLYTLRRIVESKTAALKSAQDLLDELSKRPKPGPLHRVEIANAEYAVAQRRKELVDAERNSRDTEAGLRYLIGMEPNIRIIPIDPPSRAEPPETEDQAVKAALENRPDLKQLRLTLKASELEERVSRRQKLPELNLTGGGGLNGTGDSLGNSYERIGDHPGTWWSAGLQFVYPIGNDAAKNDYIKSRIRTMQVRNQIEALALKIRNEVETDLRALISARLQMQVTDKARQTGELRREEYRKNVRARASTVQELINAENDLALAETAQLEAAEGFANGVAKMWRDTGVLLDRLGVHVDVAR
ncbi:MAG: TolC family protein [Deltaproteobacteria bacterium]|nr:TolC family protein [Deltaproteobacteria bacterium]